MEQFGTAATVECLTDRAAVRTVHPGSVGAPRPIGGPQGERPAELWHAFFAVALEAVPRDEQPAPPWGHFLCSLGMGEEQSVELRTIATPNSASWLDGRLEVYLIGCGRHEEEAPSRQSAVELFASVERALTAHMPGYGFAPIASAAALVRVLQPFEFRSVADVLRREAPLSGESGECYLVRPFAAAGESLEGLVRRLLLRAEPSLLSVCLRRTELQRQEIEYLSGARPCGDMLGFPADMASSLRRFPGASQPPRADGDDRTYGAAGWALREMFASLAPTFAMKVQIATAGLLGQGEAEGLAAQLLGPAGGNVPGDKALWGACGAQGGADIHFALGTERRKLATANLLFQGFEPWHESAAPEPLRRIRYLFGPAEAACAFRAPAGTAMEAYGLRITPLSIAPPAGLPETGIALGASHCAGTRRVVRLDRDDRRRHVYCAGQTGTGKSTLLLNMIMRDIEAGEGAALIDPHGDLATAIVERIPKSRVNDVVLFDPADRDYPVGLNMLEFDPACPHQRDMVIQEMFSIFSHLFLAEHMGPVFEQNLRNAMLLEMSDPEVPGTLVGVPLCLFDKEYRKAKLKGLSDPFVRNFWERQGVSVSPRDEAETLGYFISKLSRFIEDSTMRNILGQPRSTFNFRAIMDEGRIFIANLAVGQLGEINSSLLGCVLIFKLRMAAMSRVGVPEDHRRDFYLYVDEFQRFAANSFDVILSEARKYRLGLCVTNQNLGQLSGSLLHSILGNVGSLVCFRLGIADAKLLAEQLGSDMAAEELATLPNWRAGVRLLNRGQVTRPFTIATFPPTGPGDAAAAAAVVRRARKTYALPKSLVEEGLRRHICGEDERRG